MLIGLFSVLAVIDPSVPLPLVVKLVCPSTLVAASPLRNCVPLKSELNLET